MKARAVQRQRLEEKQVEKGKPKLDKAAVRAGQMARSLLNIRQLLDQANAQVEALKLQIAQRDQLLTAASLTDNGLIIPRDDMNVVLERLVAGYNIELENKDFIEITPVWPQEAEEEAPDGE